MMADVHGKAFSIRRRRLLMSAAAGALAPTALVAGTLELSRRTAAWTPPGDDDGRLVLSGRLTKADATPLAAQTVELVQGGAVINRSQSDADGRFVLATRVQAARGRPALRLVDGNGDSRACEQCFSNPGAHFDADAAGVWRVTVGITLA